MPSVKVMLVAVISILVSLQGETFRDWVWRQSTGKSLPVPCAADECLSLHVPPAQVHGMAMVSADGFKAR